MRSPEREHHEDLRAAAHGDTDPAGAAGDTDGAAQLGIRIGRSTCPPTASPWEIVMRGNTVMTEYFRDPQATAAAFRGGWFHAAVQEHLREKWR